MLFSIVAAEAVEWVWDEEHAADEEIQVLVVTHREQYPERYTLPELQVVAQELLLVVAAE
jgi:hypothetical protein